MDQSNQKNINLEYELKDEKGYKAQVNCAKSLSIGFAVAGEDGLIKIDQIYLPKMTGSDGYLTNIEDLIEMNTNELITFGTDGDIGMYIREDENKPFIFSLCATRINDDCLYYGNKINDLEFETWGERNIKYKFKRSKHDDKEYHLIC